MFSGAVIALFLMNAGDVLRPDGTRVKIMKNPTYKTEFLGLLETLTYEPYIVLLFPMFWSSNWFYTYQQNGINSARFDVRTRALNSLIYYLAQIIGGMVLGYFMDSKFGPLKRRTVRAKATLAILSIFTIALWGGGYAWVRKYTRYDIDDSRNPLSSLPVNPYHLDPLDWKSKGYPGPMFLYFFYGFYDSFWQAAVYW